MKKTVKYPSSELGPQKREFHETFNGFAMLRQHFGCDKKLVIGEKNC